MMSALLKANRLPHYVYEDYAQWENEWELIEYSFAVFWLVSI
jgi:hypothetical protein